MVNELLKSVTADMQKCVDGLSHELASVRTGRASPALVEGVVVEYHGAALPIKQLANIAVPEPALITIQAWDKTALRSIEKAILKARNAKAKKVIRILIPRVQMMVKAREI